MEVIRLDEEPAWKAGRGYCPLWVRVPRLPLGGTFMSAFDGRPQNEEHAKRMQYYLNRGNGITHAWFMADADLRNGIGWENRKHDSRSGPSADKDVRQDACPRPEDNEGEKGL